MAPPAPARSSGLARRLLCRNCSQMSPTGFTETVQVDGKGLDQEDPSGGLPSLSRPPENPAGPGSTRGVSGSEALPDGSQARPTSVPGRRRHASVCSARCSPRAGMAGPRARVGTATLTPGGTASALSSGPPDCSPDAEHRQQSQGTGSRQRAGFSQGKTMPGETRSFKGGAGKGWALKTRNGSKTAIDPNNRKQIFPHTHALWDDHGSVAGRGVRPTACY